MTDEGDRAERNGSVKLPSLLKYARGPQDAERLLPVLYVRSHLAPLDPPHPALRTTFPRKGGRAVPGDLIFNRFGAERTREISLASLSDVLTPQFGASRPERGVEFRIRDLAAPRDRIVERRAQREQFRFAFLDESQPLTDDLACRTVATLADHALDEPLPPLANRYVHCRLPRSFAVPHNINCA